MKTFFTFSLSLFLIVLIFLGAYNFIYRNNPLDPEVPGREPSVFTENPLSGNEIVRNSKIDLVINEEGIGQTLLDESALAYFSLSGKSLKKYSPETHSSEILIESLPGTPVEVVWSRSKDQALVLLDSNKKLLWHLVSLTDKSVRPLKENLRYPVFSNLGDKIYYQFNDPTTGNVTLNVSNPDGSNWKPLIDIPTKNIFIAPVPKSADISLWNRPNGNESSYFQTIPSAGGSLRNLLVGRFGGDYLWSPNGNLALVSSLKEKGSSKIFLATINSNGGEFTNLDIRTFVTKAAWSSDEKYLYYALPGSLPENITLPNDYFGKKLLTTDTFWKASLESGEKSRLVMPEEIGQEFDSTNLFLSHKEDILYFLNRRDGKTYGISL